jgi:hypothetical protein
MNMHVCNEKMAREHMAREERIRLRDKFAMAVMAGSQLRLWADPEKEFVQQLAERAYNVADAMLEARK